MSVTSLNRPFQIKDYVDQVLGLSCKEGLPKITQTMVWKVLDVSSTTLSKFLLNPYEGKLSGNFEKKFSKEVSSWPPHSTTIGKTLTKVDVLFFLNITQPIQSSLNSLAAPLPIRSVLPTTTTPRIQTKEIHFGNVIQEIISSDPHFSQPIHTISRLFKAVHEFLDQKGNPALAIPEIWIGNACLRNISCLELLYGNRYNWGGVFPFIYWDNLGVQICRDFNELFERCLEVVDTLTETPSLRNDEIVALIQSVHASDPYLHKGKITGNRILRLVEKFLASSGDPLLFISNVKIGDERVDKLTIYELVYLLWKLPYETDMWSWDDDDSSVEESDDEDQNIDERLNLRIHIESINDRFEKVLKQCSTVIQQKLKGDLVSDDGFLSLMRCAVEFSEDGLFDILTSEKTGKTFLHLMKYFTLRKVNPNLRLPKITIGGNVYLNATCYQVCYLLWKKPDAHWTDLDDEEFQRVFMALLYDPRTDLTLRFSERSLTAHHFVNSGNIKFYHEQHVKEKKFYSNGDYEPNPRAIDQLHGHSLERMTIAHYAVVLGDYTMLNRFLDLAPRLLNMTCCVTKGKANVDSERYIIQSKEGAIQINNLEEHDELSGVLSLRTRLPFTDELKRCHIQIVRVTHVTLLHLAARVGKEGVLSILGSRRSNPAITDSNKCTPQDYLKFSILESIVENNRSSQEMLRALGLITKYNHASALPEVNILFHHEGYDLLYNTSRKVAVFAYQRLGKNSFGTVSRTDKWIENAVIPPINRASNNDFKASGFDRGHMTPANDSTGSEGKIAASFQLENAAPQNPNLNRGTWSQLEKHVHKLALDNDLVEVFTGPLFLPEQGAQVIQHEIMGNGGVHIPTHFFKVIYIHNRNTVKEIYILPNQQISTKFSDYKCPDEDLDFIQQHSGILFSEWTRK